MTNKKAAAVEKREAQLKQRIEDKDEWRRQLRDKPADFVMPKQKALDDFDPNAMQMNRVRSLLDGYDKFASCQGEDPDTFGKKPKITEGLTKDLDNEINNLMVK